MRTNMKKELNLVAVQSPWKHEDSAIQLIEWSRKSRHRESSPYPDNVAASLHECQ